MTTRRFFLAGLAAATATPRIGWSAVGSPKFLAAARETDGSYALHGLTAAGEETFSIPLPARGHAACGHPKRAEAVGFARRPGDFALIIDCATGTVMHRLTPPEGRHFNGHGTYSGDGTLLFVSEQERAGSAGHVGIYDTAHYERVGDFATTGLGPHELRLMPDQKSLVIANGGLDTLDRDILNVDSMVPSLVYASLDGTILDKLELSADLRKNSIRHLATRADGLVGFAMQWQGDADDLVPLLGLHRMGEAPILAEAPMADQMLMKGYAGSVAFAGTGEEIAITSPHGGRLHRFSATGDFLEAIQRDDVCGLATLEDGYLASDGFGGLIRIGASGPKPLARANVEWDNHLVSL